LQGAHGCVESTVEFSLNGPALYSVTRLICLRHITLQVNGNRYLSVAKLTNEPFDEMDSRATAPRIYAMVLSKEAEFASGDSVIPQVMAS